MADTTALKNRIRAAIKANDNQEITGPVLQQSLLDIVDELNGATETEASQRQSGDSTLQQGINTERQARIDADNTLQQNIVAEKNRAERAETQLNNLITGIKNNIDNGYVYAGIATPSTNPVSGKVFYLALTAGTYTNFGNITVAQGINILKYNGSTWSVEQVWGVTDEPLSTKKDLITANGCNLLTTLYSNIDIVINTGVGLVVTGLKIYNNADYRYKITNPIPCKQGDVFSYSGVGRSAAISWFIRKGTTILEEGQYEGTTNVTITNADADNIIFASFKTTTDASSVVLQIGLPYKTIKQQVSSGYKYFGMADTNTNPQVPTTKGYYIAYENGTYTHFGNLQKNTDKPILLLWDGVSWSISPYIMRSKIETDGSITSGFLTGKDRGVVTNSNAPIGFLFDAYVRGADGIVVVSDSADSFGGRIVTNYIKGRFTLGLQSDYIFVNAIQYTLAGQFIGVLQITNNQEFTCDDPNVLVRFTIGRTNNANFDGTETISDIITGLAQPNPVYIDRVVNISSPVQSAQTNFLKSIYIKKGSYIHIKPSTSASWSRLLIGYNEDNSKRIKDNIANGEDIMWRCTEDITSLWYFVQSSADNFTLEIKVESDLVNGNVIQELITNNQTSIDEINKLNNRNLNNLSNSINPLPIVFNRYIASQTGDLAVSDKKRACSGWLYGSFYIKLKSGYCFVNSCKYTLLGERTQVTGYDITVGNQTTELSIRNNMQLCRFTIMKSDNSEFTESESLLDIVDEFTELYANSNNPLYGKTVYSFGDSLMYGHYSQIGMLDGLIAKEGMFYNKYAIDGAKILGTGQADIITQINGASSTEPDFVVLDGLINDAYDNIVSEHLGSISDNYTGLYDTTSFYGAFETIIYTLRNKYHNANIIYVAPHNMPTRTANAQATLQNAVKEVCKKWSIPVVDIFVEGQINTNIAVLKNAWSYNNQGETSGGNGTHLTGAGYNKFYAPLIKEQMIKMLMS